MVVDKICCFQLRFFALIWGWLGVGESVFGVIVGLVSLLRFDHVSETVKNFQFLHLGIAHWLAIFTFCMLVSALSSSGLIISVLKENHKFMLPWIFYETFSIACEILQIILLVAVLVANPTISGYNHYDIFDLDGNFVQTYDKQNDYAALASLFLIFKITSAAFRIYVFIGTWNLFKNYREERRTTPNVRDLLITRNENYLH